MATKFKLKRSTIGGIVPTTADIDTAELAVNLADKKLYTSNGTVVFEIGSNLTNLSVSGNLTINTIIANGSIGIAGQVLHSNGTSVYWDTDDQGVAGSNTEIQFNDSDSLGANLQFTYNKVTDTLFVGNTEVSGKINSAFISVENITVSNTIVANVLTANGSNGQAGQVLSSNGAGIYWSNLAASFTDLTDTPSTYTDKADQLVTVNSTETGLTFTNELNIEEIQLDQLQHVAQIAPGSVESDTVVVYVTASGISPNREVAYKIKNELGNEVIISSILV
jgi:hypothetical protein